MYNPNNRYVAGSSVAMVTQQQGLGEYQQYGGGGYQREWGSAEDWIRTGLEVGTVVVDAVGAGSAATGNAPGSNDGGARRDAGAVNLGESGTSFWQQLRNYAEREAAKAIVRAKEAAGEVVDPWIEERAAGAGREAGREAAKEAGTQAFEFAKATVPLVVGGIIIVSMLRAGRRR